MTTTAPMPLYRGTKELFATPMSRGEYNDYRGWTPPEGEDQSASGYLVEYADGGDPNDERHGGYISWSPKDVFDRTYAPCETHVDRMRIEHAELEDRLKNLTAFIGTPAFDALDADETDALRSQHDAMTSYRNILAERLDRAATSGNVPGDDPDKMTVGKAMAQSAPSASTIPAQPPLTPA